MTIKNLLKSLKKWLQSKKVKISNYLEEYLIMALLISGILVGLFFYFIWRNGKLAKQGHYITPGYIYNLEITEDKISYSKKNATLSTFTYDKETSTVLLNIDGYKQNLRAGWENIGFGFSEITTETHHKGGATASRTTGYTTDGKFFSGTTQTGYTPAYSTTNYSGEYVFSLTASFGGIVPQSASFENRGVSSGLDEMEFNLGRVHSTNMVDKIRSQLAEWKSSHEIWMKDKGKDLLASFEKMENEKLLNKQVELKEQIAIALNLELNDENPDCFLLAEINHGSVFLDRIFAYNNLDFSKYRPRFYKVYGRPGTEYINHDWMKTSSTIHDNTYFLNTNNDVIQLLHKGEKNDSFYFKIPFKMLGKIDRKSLEKWRHSEGIPPYDQADMDLKITKLIAL